MFKLMGKKIITMLTEEPSGALVKYLTRDRGDAGLSLTGGSALCP